jgi:sterol desaturase/sphingolipid hydroxylase (fatty acid hydroxylase superfamily)
MRLSATTYYSDYILYPTLATALTAASLGTTPFEKWGVWTLSVAAGAATWTFAEYQLHRWVLHHVPYVKEMHEAHHNDQKALIGTPPWLSLALMIILVLLPAILIVGFSYGAGFTTGILLGYFFYIIVHHGVHHWRLRPGSYLYKLKHRHALHHHFDDEGNFGVTTSFWDKVFRTDIKVDRSGRRA